MNIATKEDVLKFFTKTMRSRDESIKFADKFRSAELLGKYYGLFSDKHTESVGDVIIVDNIAGAEGNGIPS